VLKKYGLTVVSLEEFRRHYHFLNRSNLLNPTTTVAIGLVMVMVMAMAMAMAMVMAIAMAIAIAMVMVIGIRTDLSPYACAFRL